MSTLTHAESRVNRGTGNVRPRPRGTERPYDKCPRDLRAHPGLSDYAFRVYAAVLDFNGMPLGCIASNEDISRATGGKGVRTVQRALDELEHWGQIVRIFDPTGRHRLRIELTGKPIDRPAEVRQPCHTPRLATVPDEPQGATDLSYRGATDLSPYPEQSDREQEDVNVNGSLHSLKTKPQTPESKAAPFTREDLAQLKGNPTLVKPAARFIAGELGDEKSTGFFKRLCSSVAEEREPSERLTDSFDAACKATWADNPGAAFTVKWNGWKPKPTLGADDPAEAFIRTNWPWIVPQVKEWAGDMLKNGWPHAEIRKRAPGAAARYADACGCYTPHQKEGLLRGYLRALDKTFSECPREPATASAETG
jgi:hypothetical protein